MRLRFWPLSKNRQPVADPYDGLPEPFGADMRALGPVHVCSCGSQVFNVMASFDDYELVWYFLDGTCVSCGNIVKVPCPEDRPV